MAELGVIETEVEGEKEIATEIESLEEVLGKIGVLGEAETGVEQLIKVVIGAKELGKTVMRVGKSAFLLLLTFAMSSRAFLSIFNKRFWYIFSLCSFLFFS